MEEDGLETFVVRGTNSDLDELAVICGPSEEFVMKDHNSSFGKKVLMRPFIRFGHDSADQTALVDGLWIEQKFLINNPDEIFETTRPGKFIRSFNLHLTHHEIVLVEYEDRLQVGVVEINTIHPEQGDTTLFTIYKEKKHLGSIKLLMDDCYTENLKEFMQEVRDL